jgi:hypothetical protein
MFSVGVQRNENAGSSPIVGALQSTTSLCEVDGRLMLKASSRVLYGVWSKFEPLEGGVDWWMRLGFSNAFSCNTALGLVSKRGPVANSRFDAAFSVSLVSSKQRVDAPLKIEEVFCTSSNLVSAVMVLT